MNGLSILCISSIVPLTALFEGDALPAKYVECTANS